MACTCTATGLRHFIQSLTQIDIKSFHSMSSIFSGRRLGTLNLAGLQTHSFNRLKRVSTRRPRYTGYIELDQKLFSNWNSCTPRRWTRMITAFVGGSKTLDRLHNPPMHSFVANPDMGIGLRYATQASIRRNSQTDGRWSKNPGFAKETKPVLDVNFKSIQMLAERASERKLEPRRENSQPNNKIRPNSKSNIPHTRSKKELESSIKSSISRTQGPQSVIGASERRLREPWQIQKGSLREKFAEGWSPRKRLSPDALAGIRALHAQFPKEYPTSVLAEKFEVSPEAIRRILKGKWLPKHEEEIDRRKRWLSRGQKIWSRYAELGLKPPLRWRDQSSLKRTNGDNNQRFSEQVITNTEGEAPGGELKKFAEEFYEENLAERIL